MASQTVDFSLLAQSLAGSSIDKPRLLTVLDDAIKCIQSDSVGLNAQYLLLNPHDFPAVYRALLTLQDEDSLTRLLRVIAPLLSYGETFSGMKLAGLVELDGQQGLRQCLVRVLKLGGEKDHILSLTLEALAEIQTTQKGCTWPSAEMLVDTVSVAIQHSRRHANVPEIRLRLCLFLGNVAATAPADIRRHIAREAGNMVGLFAQFACSEENPSPLQADLALSLMHNLCMDDAELAFEIYSQRLALEAACSALRVFTAPSLRLSALCLLADLATVCMRATPIPPAALGQVYDCLRGNLDDKDYVLAGITALARMTSGVVELRREYVRLEESHLLPNEPLLATRVLLLWKNDFEVVEKCLVLAENVSLFGLGIIRVHARQAELIQSLLSDVIARWSTTSYALHSVVYPARTLLASLEDSRPPQRAATPSAISSSAYTNDLAAY